MGTQAHSAVEGRADRGGLRGGAGLGAGFQRAVYMSGVANVRNPRLARSLRASLQQFANLELHEQTEVRGWLRDGDRVVGVATSRGEIRGDKVLLAAGAWSGELLKPLGLELPVVPVKGQMILYKCAADFLPRMVLAAGATRFRGATATS